MKTGRKNYIYLFFGVIIVIVAVMTVIFFPRRLEPKPKYQSTPKLVLENYLVALDPGHGGIDGGSSYGIVKEKDITLAIAKKTRNVLEKWGTRVILSREGDYEISKLYLDERTRQRRDLLARIKVAQEENANVLVSIHVNAAQSHLQGPMVFYQKDLLDSKLLAGAILQELHKIARHQQQDLIGANYFILCQAKIPAVLVEVGFLTHPEERTKLQTEEYQQQLAIALATGIKNFLLSRENYRDGPIAADSGLWPL